MGSIDDPGSELNTSFSVNCVKKKNSLKVDTSLNPHQCSRKVWLSKLAASENLSIARYQVLTFSPNKTPLSVILCFVLSIGWLTLFQSCDALRRP